METDGAIPQWDLGDRLSKALHHGGVSVQEMADYLGVSRNSVGNYLAGRTKPTRGALIAWSLRTGVDLSWLETGRPPSGHEGVGGRPGDSHLALASA